MTRVLRPMGVIGLIDEVVHVYRANLLLLVGIGALVYIPAQLLVLLTGNSGFWMLYRISAVIAASVASTAMVYAVSQYYMERSTTVLESYGAVLLRPISFLNTIVATGLLVTIGMSVFLIPGIVLGYLYALVGPVFVIEGLTGSKARKRSMGLVSGQWKLILGSNLCIYASQGGIPAIVYALMRNTMHAGPHSPATALVTATLAVVLCPPAAIVSALIYYDIRIRKEGFDIELLARDVEASAETDEMKEPSVAV